MVQLKFEGPFRLRAMGSFTDMEMTLGLKIYLKLRIGWALEQGQEFLSIMKIRDLYLVHNGSGFRD